jgi:alkanesulfonate monooxygenase SsuD/methylene tetrahydromethanopterin reductase-like flavin-dependent oxidoreductase (luciferase family)
MDLALMTEPQVGGTYEEILTVARWAEANGLVSFARSDHYYGWGRQPKPDATDAFATLAGLARETSRIELAVLVAPFTFRHPAVVLKNATTIDQMSAGRLALGVGTGWNEEEHVAFGLPFPPWQERFARLEEGLAYLRAAFGGGRFRGSYYHLDASVEPKKTGALPIIVGGSGPKRTPELAGRYADEYNVFVSDPATISARVQVLRRSAEAAGRDPDSIRVSVMGPIVAHQTRDGYEEILAARAAKRGVSTSDQELRWRAVFLPIGTTDQVGETLARFESVGVSRYYVQFVDLPSTEHLDEAFSGIPR